MGANNWDEAMKELRQELAPLKRDAALAAAPFQLVQGAGNRAVFAFGAGAFIHVPDDDHLAAGREAGLFAGDTHVVGLATLDRVYTLCTGGAELAEAPNFKGQPSAFG